MNILKASLAALALLGLTTSAFAGGFKPGGPLPSVRSQILTEAKLSGETKGMTKPGLRLTYSKSGKTVSAALTAMSAFNGGPKPLANSRRIVLAVAKFRVGQAKEGKIATPIKQAGRVWQMILRSVGPTR